MTPSDPSDPTEAFTRDSGPTRAGAGRTPFGGRPGDRVDAYLLLELVGEGGFGEVWLAEQKDPVARRVALKIIKPGMDSRAVIARFEQERQVLALLSHPNIAKVFDAGTTSGGLPYFVMEYVEGETLVRYCDRERLTVAQRLRLFAVICDAAQHAHMKGIIHRDLKPGNILVTVGEGGDPRPVVIDFGVAKAIEQRLTEQTLFTAQGMLIGTPEYMSPEQAEMAETDIDTRTDIYALGVILYELLTGVVPFPAESLRRAGYEAIRRTIREQEPPRPSTRLSTLGEKAERVADTRRVKLRDLRSQLQSELEWIPLRAMRKERAERYRSAAELADDVRNYLESRPLIAGPEGAGYRLKKFVRRNKIAVGAGAIVAAALVAATGISAWFAVRESRQKEAAISAGTRAESIKEFLVRTLQSSHPELAGRQDILVSEALITGAGRLESGALAGDPATRAEILIASADILRGNGRSDAALPLAEDATSILRSLDPPENERVANALRTLAKVQEDLGHLSEAESSYVRALDLYGGMPDGDDAALATCLSDYAAFLAATSRLEEAEPLTARALEMRERLFPGDHQDVETSLSNLAQVRLNMGQASGADSLYARALEMQKRLFAGDHLDVARGLDNLGWSRWFLGRHEEADSLWVLSLDMRRRLFPGDHPDLAQSLETLATHRTPSAEAESLMAEAVEMSRRLYPGDSPNVARSLNNLAYIRQALGRPAGAESLYSEAAQMTERIYGSDHPYTVRCLMSLGSVLLELDRAAEAAPLFERAVDAGRRRSAGDDYGLATSLVFLAAARHSLGSTEEARRLFDEGIAMHRRLAPDGSRNLARALWRSARARLAGGDTADARTELEEAVAVAERVLPADHREIREYRHTLTECGPAPHE